MAPPARCAGVDGEVERDTVWLRSCTTKLAAGPAEWEGRYRPVSESFEAEPGTVEYFLMERWALYTVDGEGCLHRSKIHRLPWQLQRARAEIHKNTVAIAHGIQLPEKEPLLHCSRGVDVLIWLPEKLD